MTPNTMAMATKRARAAWRTPLPDPDPATARRGACLPQAPLHCGHSSSRSHRIRGSPDSGASRCGG